MGNNLCRERIARADNSKNPIDRIIGRCAQICPANEVKPNYWQKHVLQTGPTTPTRSQPAFDDGWRKVTLTVPNGKTNNDGGGGGGGSRSGDLGETPIAPPRRKRSSVIDRQPKPVGFKELFGNNVSRRSSCDSILKEENLSALSEREQEMLQQKRKSRSISDFSLNETKAPDSLTISTIRIPVTRTLSLMERAMVQQTTIPAPRPVLQRKISRVGNKKSDKFFGENLSDCLSDDPITPDVPEPTSISFTYHTISTLITPIPHSQCVDFVNANIPTASDADGNRTVYTSGVEPNDKTKPFTVSECVDARRGGGDRKSSLDKKAEFLMAMLEGTNVLPASTATEENNKYITPPRRSHLKKKQNIQSNENGVTVDSIAPEGRPTTVIVSHNNESNALQHSQEKAIERQSIEVVNKEAGTKTEPKVEIIDNSGGADDNEMYRGMTPVEEPIIVPRRRITKHICDGDDHHQHNKKHVDGSQSANQPANAVHQNENENKENEPNGSSNDRDIEQYIIQQVTQSSTPEKPKRDFSNVAERSNQKSDEFSAPTTPKPNEKVRLPGKPVPAMRVRHLSQDSLIPKTMTTTAVAASPITGGTDPLKKYTSQQSFFTQDLLNQWSDRMYGFQDDPFDPSETCDDGSAKCTPNSKLTTRKVSVHRKESTVNRPILENDAFECATDKGDSAPKIVQMEQKESKSTIASSPTESNNEINKMPSQIPIEQPKSASEQFILIERGNSNVCDGKIEPNVSETADNSVAAPPSRPQQEPNDSHKANNGTNSNVAETKCNNVVIPKTSALAPLANGEDMTLEAGNSSDDENTDSDTTVKTQLNNNHIEALTKTMHGDAKRDSIVEVDAWFLRHNDLANQSRRSSESQVAYDTRRVFPFGQPEPGAGAAFFDSKSISKSAENVLNEKKFTKPIEPALATAAAIIATTTTSIGSNDTKSDESASTTDHSILLKYLK